MFKDCQELVNHGKGVRHPTTCILKTVALFQNMQKIWPKKNYPYSEKKNLRNYVEGKR